MTRYAPGYTGPKLPAAVGPRPGVKQTVTGTRPTPPVIDIKPPPQNYIGPRDAMGYPTSSTTVQPRGTPQPNQNPLYTGPGIKKMGMKKGGKVSSASKRADGIAVKGKTKGRMV